MRRREYVYIYIYRTIKSRTIHIDSVALQASKRYPMPDNCPLAECSRDDARCFCRSPICPEILETIVGLIPAADSIGQCTRLRSSFSTRAAPCPYHRSNNDRSRVFGKLCRVENRDSLCSVARSIGFGLIMTIRAKKRRLYSIERGPNCGKSDHRIAAWPR